MEWLKTSLLVFILFIFAINNVNSYPANTTSILTENTELSSTEESFMKNTTSSLGLELNTTLSANITSSDIESTVKNEPYGFNHTMTPEQPINSAKEYCSCIEILEEMYEYKTDSSKSCYERNREILEQIEKSQKAAEGVLDKRKSDNSYSNSNSGNSSSSDTDSSYVYKVILWIALAAIVIGCIIWCAIASKRRRRLNGRHVPVYNNGNQFANVQLEDNLVQRNPAAGETAPRTPATTRSSEFAVEIGMDEKTKTGVSSSNVEENNN